MTGDARRTYYDMGRGISRSVIDPLPELTATNIMPLTRAAHIRDLLLPGLRAIEGQYPQIVRDRLAYFDGTVTNMPPTRYAVETAYDLGFAITREALDDALYREMFSYPRIDSETAAASRERARGLLKSLLTPEQWVEFEASRKVTERIGDREFELTPGGMVHVRKPAERRLLRREQPKLIERWCVNPRSGDYLPVEDQLIGQLLHLRAGPDKLREQANVFPAS